MCICLGVYVHGNVGNLGGTVRNDLGRKYSLGWGTMWDYGTFTCRAAHWSCKTLGPWPALSLPGAMLDMVVLGKYRLRGQGMDHLPAPDFQCAPKPDLASSFWIYY